MTDSIADHPYSQSSGTSFIPIAECILESPTGTDSPPSFPQPTGQAYAVINPCLIRLDEGCYRIGFNPGPALSFPSFGEYYLGTMRLDRAGGGITISGDFYRFLPTFVSLPRPSFFQVFPLDIPVYPRDRYYSYLQVTNIQANPIGGTGRCNLTLTIGEYIYTQPPAGSFNGTFPAIPSRTVTVVLEPQVPPSGFSGPYFAGKLYEGTVEKGIFTMGWVSSFFRKATLEIDTLVGAVAPTAVPDASGTRTEDFRTVFATAGWDLTFVYDQVNVAVPAGVTATTCWSDANLHALMLSVRNPATNLDTEWHMHLVVVPATIGCGRGKMYDSIIVPREGVASFSDDGYDTPDTFGNTHAYWTAANQQQRNVSRAFLRSACHEVGHGFNQHHQDNPSLETTGADNSIMTTTPSVADFLRGPFALPANLFPKDIALSFNNHVRHHMIHLPDPVVRPGGMTFGVGHTSSVPQADNNRYFYASEELELKLMQNTKRIKLGEPLPLAWELINNAKEALLTPNDIRIEAQHTMITVVNPNGVSRRMPSFIIQTDGVSFQELTPGKKLEAGTTLFWSSNSFAFEVPGKHSIEVVIRWKYGGIPYGVKANTQIWVDYPVSDADNEVATMLLHKEVGVFVALGGGAKHLEEAVSRIEGAISEYSDHPASKYMKELGGHKHSKIRKKE